MNRFLSVLVMCAFGGLAAPVAGQCPSADLTGDCRVDFADIAVVASQWMFDGSPPEDDTVAVTAGTFQMGDSFLENGTSDRLPLHTVTVSSFRISRYETTYGQYCEFLNSALSEGAIVLDERGEVQSAGLPYNVYYCATASSWDASAIIFSKGAFKIGNKGLRPMSNDPVIAVSWYGAVAYCNWRSQQEGREPCYPGNDPHLWECDFSANGYHLPTEAQWEYAARGGLAGRRFPWGDTIDHTYANYTANGRLYTYDTSPYTTGTYHPAWADGIMPYTSPVGSFPANGYGLCDVTGNVWEWCNDWYGAYASASQTDPAGPATGIMRIQRGGSWLNIAGSCGVAYRSSKFPDTGGYTGFRICRK